MVCCTVMELLCCLTTCHIVRNRSKELVELLGDVDKIRAERRKAKTNKNKYTGVGNDGGLSFSSGGSRYGGFGSESLGYGGSSSGYGGSSGSYGGDYSGRGPSSFDVRRCLILIRHSSDYDSYPGGGSSGGFRDSSSRRNYEEYDAGDDDVVTRRSNSVRRSTASPAPRRSAATPSTSAAPDKPKAPEPVPDLLGLDDDDFSAPVATPPAAASTNANKALPTVAPAADRKLLAHQSNSIPYLNSLL
jgi:epsin